MLEGLDRHHIPLMLEAAQEFDQGVQTAAKIAQSFVKLLEKSASGSKTNNPGMPKFIDGVKKLATQLAKVDTSNAPSEFSFKANIEMRDADGDDVVAQVTQSAATLDVFYNGTKDAIIGLAGILDPDFKEVFSVGAKGIVFTPEFAKVEGIEEQISFMDFINKTPEEIVSAISGSDEQDGWVEPIEPEE